ncbi:MAG: hypothetical protein GC180_02775 [Bacteroidetes bacterium]|nr:hypothetical protein [Bacteroidota bacterium]
MRKLLFFFLFILLMAGLSQAQIEPINYPNLVLFNAKSDKPRIEVYFTGSMRQLEKKMKNFFLDSNDREATIETNGSELKIGPVYKPILTGSSYSITLKKVELEQKGVLLQIYVENNQPKYDMLAPRMKIFRQMMAYIQNLIDEEQNARYYEKEQVPNHMYIFTPSTEIERNLYSYLFMYSLDPIDTTMKKLSDWIVYNCPNKSKGSWINDSTFRIDGLQQIAFGLTEPFSMTFQVGTVEKGYHQYIIYLSNYKENDPENSYQIRPYDVNLRLWRFYNTWLRVPSSRN